MLLAELLIYLQFGRSVHDFSMEIQINRGLFE